MNIVDSGGSWLHRVFVDCQVLESELDALFEDAPWPTGMKVVLYNEVDAGLGGVAFMTKLAHLLAREVGGPRLVLVTTGPQKQAKFVLPEGLTLISALEAKGHEALRDCDLVISAPGIFDHCRDGELVLSALGLPLSTPFVYLAQYGSIRQLRVDAFRGLGETIDEARDLYLDDLANAAGVDPDDVGFRGRTGEVVVVEDAGPRVIGRLDGLFLDPEDPRNPLGPLLRTPMLAARSCGLERGELGVHIDEALSTRAREIASRPKRRLRVAAEIEHALVRELVVGCLEDDGQLYHGYAHSGHTVFHDVVTVIARKDAGDVLVVSPDRRDAETVLARDFPAALRQRMASRGFGGVSVTGGAADNAAETVRFEDRWGEGPSYEVVTIFPLVHEDMKRLMLVSAAPTMVTGDQSFSDAISALKSVAVIEPFYCQTWHLDAVCALAGAIDGGAEAVLRSGLHYEWTPANIDAALPALEAATTWRGFERLTATIATDRNLNSRIGRLVKRALWSLTPSLQAATMAWVNPQRIDALRRLRGLASDAPTFDLMRYETAPWQPSHFPRRTEKST